MKPKPQTPAQMMALAQHKTDVLQQTMDALAYSTKVLSDSTLRDLLYLAQKTAYASDATMPFRVTSQHHENAQLQDQVITVWNRQLALQHDLDQIRKYHGFATAEALKAAVEAGQRASVP